MPHHLELFDPDGRATENTSENLSAAPAENGTGARLINHIQQAGTGTGRRSDLQKRNARSGLVPESGQGGTNGAA